MPFGLGATGRCALGGRPGVTRHGKPVLGMQAAGAQSVWKTLRIWQTTRNRSFRICGNRSGTRVATSSLEAGALSRFETGGGHADRRREFVGLHRHAAGREPRRPTPQRPEAPRPCPDRGRGRPTKRTRLRSRRATPRAPFVAHLIATRMQAPQTRARRRAEPEEAISVYRSMTQAGHGQARVRHAV